MVAVSAPAQRTRACGVPQHGARTGPSDLAHQPDGPTTTVGLGARVSLRVGRPAPRLGWPPIAPSVSRIAGLLRAPAALRRPQRLTACSATKQKNSLLRVLRLCRHPPPTARGPRRRTRCPEDKLASRHWAARRRAPRPCRRSLACVAKTRPGRRAAAVPSATGPRLPGRWRRSRGAPGSRSRRPVRSRISSSFCSTDATALSRLDVTSQSLRQPVAELLAAADEAVLPRSSLELG